MRYTHGQPHNVSFVPPAATYKAPSNAFLMWNRFRALRNLDLSMTYFGSLDRDDFEESLAKVLRRGKPLKPVDQLYKRDDVEGIYVMVFDEHKHLYVGAVRNIRAWVMQH